MSFISFGEDIPDGGNFYEEGQHDGRIILKQKLIAINKEKLAVIVNKYKSFLLSSANEPTILKKDIPSIITEYLKEVLK